MVCSKLFVELETPHNFRTTWLLSYHEHWGLMTNINMQLYVLGTYNTQHQNNMLVTFVGSFNSIINMVTIMVGVIQGCGTFSLIMACVMQCPRSWGLHNGLRCCHLACMIFNEGFNEDKILQHIWHDVFLSSIFIND